MKYPVDEKSIRYITQDELREMANKISEKTILRMSLTDAKRVLMGLKNEISKRAQKIYDDWEQDEDGFDEMLGGGGVCDEIANEISDVLVDAGFSVIPAGQDGDDHAWVYAYNGEEAFEVDIPPSVYESGSGYSWKKRKDVKINPNDVYIGPIDIDDLGLKQNEIDEAKDIWADVSKRYSKSGIQLKRKDKDLMTDTGGESKKRKEPQQKPSRWDQAKPFSKKHKKPNELDTDTDLDKDLKLAGELIKISELLR